MSNKTLLWIGLGIVAYLIYQKMQTANAAALTQASINQPGAIPSAALPVVPLTQQQIDAMIVEIPNVVSAGF